MPKKLVVEHTASGNWIFVKSPNEGQEVNKQWHEVFTSLANTLLKGNKDYPKGVKIGNRITVSIE